MKNAIKFAAIPLMIISFSAFSKDIIFNKLTILPPSTSISIPLRISDGQNHVHEECIMNYSDSALIYIPTSYFLSYSINFSRDSSSGLAGRYRDIPPVLILSGTPINGATNLDANVVNNSPTASMSIECKNGVYNKNIVLNRRRHIKKY
ncbi:MAG: hypothetical protein ACTSR1_00180 [Candidatus Heimdallarchaeota archaeon]